MTRREPKVTVVARGPYEVTGDVALRARSVATTKQGEPLTWRPGATLPHGPTYYLCRCGQSRDKPFCDGSHAFELFDGTETAATTTFADRAERHEGPGITVHKDGDLCHHAQFCKQALTNWFELIPRTDSTAALSELVAMIERCPSGALTYELDGEEIEPALPEAIAPVANGPLFVSGRITIERADGAFIERRNRVSLCRCGRSANKPLCDGTHADVGFEA